MKIPSSANSLKLNISPYIFFFNSSHLHFPITYSQTLHYTCVTGTYHCVVFWTIDEGETEPLGSPTLTPRFRSLPSAQEFVPLSPLPFRQQPCTRFHIQFEDLDGVRFGIRTFWSAGPVGRGLKIVSVIKISAPETVFLAFPGPTSMS